MGVGTGLYMYNVVVKKFTFTVSSPDEFLVLIVICVDLPLAQLLDLELLIMVRRSRCLRSVRLVLQVTWIFVFPSTVCKVLDTCASIRVVCTLYNSVHYHCPVVWSRDYSHTKTACCYCACKQRSRTSVLHNRWNVNRIVNLLWCNSTCTGSYSDKHCSTVQDSLWYVNALVWLAWHWEERTDCKKFCFDSLQIPKSLNSQRDPKGEIFGNSAYW